MKYLVDENISMADKFIADHPEFENVRKAIRIGAIDEEIITKAKLNDDVIITKDIRLTVNALIQGIKVWYYDAKGTGHKLVARSF